MALPPPWLTVFRALKKLPETSEVGEKTAQALALAIEDAGWRIVPAHAVDEGKLRVDLGLGRHIRTPSDSLTHTVKVERPTQ